MSSFGITANVGGVAVQGAVQSALEGNITVEKNGNTTPLPVAQAGTISTKTDANTGIALLTDGHGLLENDDVAVFWDGGLRYGMIVGALVDTTHVPLEGGTGTDLPAAPTAVTIVKRVEAVLAVDGDLIEILAASSTQRAHVEFQSDADASLLAAEIPANGAVGWASDVTFGTNPLAGVVVDHVMLANSSATAVANVIVGVNYDA